MPKLWTPEADPREIKVEWPHYEEPSSDTFLRSLLERRNTKGPEQFKLTLEMHGIYALPEQWRIKLVRNRYCFNNFQRTTRVSKLTSMMLSCMELTLRAAR